MPVRRNRNHKSARPATSPVIKDVPTLLQKAQEYIDKLDPQGALIFLKEAMALEPENIQVIDLTASTLMDAGDDENAFPVRSVLLLLSSDPCVAAREERPDRPRSQLREVDVPGTAPGA